MFFFVHTVLCKLWNGIWGLATGKAGVAEEETEASNLGNRVTDCEVGIGLEKVMLRERKRLVFLC